MRVDILHSSRLHALRARVQGLTHEQYAVLTLVLLAGLSLVTYWAAFVGPLGLLELRHHAQLDLQKASMTNSMLRWMQLVAFTGLGVLYVVGWRTARGLHGWQAWAVVLLATLAFSMALLFVFPYDADDIFDNIMHGRMVGIYGANPFLQLINQFPNDPLRPYAGWPSTPSAYGPLWEILAGLAARFAGNGIVSNVVTFKLLNSIFLAGSLGMVAAILRKAAPERELAGVLLLAWNPVVLFETLGMGHNDIAMVFCILAAAWALFERRYTLAILGLIAGGLVKFIPVLLIPAAGMVALRELPDLRSRLRFVAVTAIVGAAAICATYASFWHGIGTLGITRREQLFTTSLPATLFVWLKSAWGTERAARLVSRGGAALAAIFALGMGVRAWHDRSWDSFARSAVYTLLFYLMVTGPWFQNWYAIWPLGIAALLPMDYTGVATQVFAFATLSKPYIFAPMFLWRRPFPSQTWRELRLGPAVMLVPWLYSLYALVASRLQRQQAHARPQVSRGG